jgi:hypothetical protein
VSLLDCAEVWLYFFFVAGEVDGYMWTVSSTFSLFISLGVILHSK